MKKKLFACLSLLMALLIGMSLSVSAYQPGYDGLEDIRWYGGYNPDSGLSVLSDVSNGVRCVFKHDSTIMWANRVVAGWDYDISEADSAKKGKIPSQEGIYVHLTDIKWDVPKASPANKEPRSSVMITVAATQGGWSDGRALMFWILKDSTGHNSLCILRGADPNENVAQFVLNPNYMDLNEQITDEIHFWMRRTDANTWTVNINGNVIKLDDKTQVSERFIEMNKLAVSLGTWNSAGAVEYTVSDLWSYNCIEYDAANPPAFVKSVRSQSAATTKPTAGSSATSRPAGTTAPQTTAKVPDATNTVTDPAGAVTETTVGVEESVLPESSIAESEADTSTEATDPDAPAPADTKPAGSNWIIWLVAALIVVVLAGGGAAFYFLFLRKPADKNSGDL